MRRTMIALVALSLIGAGCAPAPGTPSPELPTAPPAVETSAPSAEAEAFYIAYTEAEYEKARSEGRPVLLYFWASWCPICRAEEPKLKAVVESMDLPIAGFRVNFDTETRLKQEFKVPYQHTTIILNARGEETERFIGPTDDETLRAAIRAAAQ